MFSTAVKRSLLLLVSCSYLFVEYFFRERLLLASSYYGYSFNVADLELVGRYIAAFGCAWFVFLITRSRFKGGAWQRVAKHVALFLTVFLLFFKLQIAGIDWYVDNMTADEKQVAVSAQTYKAYAYYQELSGKPTYNPDGKIGFEDKLLLSFIPWLADDNKQIRSTMNNDLISIAKSNVSNDIKYNGFRYQRIQDGVENALLGMSRNYLGSLDNEKFGVDHLLAEPKFSETVDEYHTKLQLLAIQEFYRYRSAVLEPYRGRLGGGLGMTSHEHYSGLDRYYYTQNYPNARHPRLTRSGFENGEWLYNRPPRSFAQNAFGANSSRNLINPVSKLDAFFAKYRYHETVDTVSALEERTTAFESALRASLTGLSIPDGVLLREYQEAVNTVKACRSFDSPQALSRAYDHTWNGKGYHFIQVSSHWRQSSFDYTKRSRVSVTARAPLNMDKRPLRFGSDTFNASEVEGMAKAGVTVCDPYQYQSVFNRYVYRLIQSINMDLYESKTDMVSFSQFANSAYWNKQVPAKIAQYGFEVERGFNWQSKRAIGAVYRKQIIDNHRNLFEEALLNRLAAFSSQHEFSDVRKIYEDSGQRLPLWQYDESDTSVRRVMRHLSEQPVIRTVINQEYPFMFDKNGVLLINYLYKSPPEYKDERELERAFMVNVERVMKQRMETLLAKPDSNFYQLQARAFVIVPIALLLSTLFILLNAVNLLFMILKWTPLPKIALKVVHIGVLVSVLLAPMLSKNEYTESGFYDDYRDNSDSVVIPMVIWLQGSAPLFDGINSLMGDYVYRQGNNLIKRWVKDLSV